MTKNKVFFAIKYFKKTDKNHITLKYHISSFSFFFVSLYVHELINLSDTDLSLKSPKPFRSTAIDLYLNKQWLIHLT